MDLKKTLAEAIDMTPEEAADVESKLPTSAFRRWAEYEMSKRRDDETAKMFGPAPMSHLDYLNQRGLVQGLEVAISILNRKGKIKTS